MRPDIRMNINLDLNSQIVGSLIVAKVFPISEFLGRNWPGVAHIQLKRKIMDFTMGQKPN